MNPTETLEGNSENAFFSIRETSVLNIPSCSLLDSASFLSALPPDRAHVAPSQPMDCARAEIEFGLNIHCAPDTGAGCYTLWVWPPVACGVTWWNSKKSRSFARSSRGTSVKSRRGGSQMLNKQQPRTVFVLQDGRPTATTACQLATYLTRPLKIVNANCEGNILDHPVNIGD